MSAAAAVPEETTGSGKEAALQAWRDSQRALKATRRAKAKVEAQAERARQVREADHFTEKLRSIMQGGGVE